MKNLSWDDFLRERWRREDETVAKKFLRFANLGTGHLRTDIVRLEDEPERYRNEEKHKNRNRTR